MQDEYDREQVSKSFKESAELAGYFYRANVQDGPTDAAAEAKQDELLARLAVYGHLHDQHFLQTRELLLTELRWMLKNGRPLAPRQVLERDRFAVGRAEILEMLIRRFELVEGIGPGAANDPALPQPPLVGRKAGGAV